MTNPAVLPEVPPPEVAPGWYATFPRRLNALTVDSIVLISFSLLAFLLLPAVGRFPVLRLTLGIGWWATILLYEPLTVAGSVALWGIGY